MNEELHKKIEEMVQSKKVFLFMKGVPDAPQCGFSAQTVEVLRKHTQDFGSFDVLSDESIREGVKEYSDWPTIPQLFIDGKFIGGCDISLISIFCHHSIFK
jgi:monothiol glutaredoxin